jgi:hypothetical protein
LSNYARELEPTAAVSVRAGLKFQELGRYRASELAFAAGRSNEWRLVRLNQSSFARDLGCTVQIVQFWMAFHEFVVEAGARELQTRRLASAARNLKRLSAALPRHERL